METNWKKNTALFLTGQALSLFGSMVVQYAIVWHITLKTHSGSMITLFTIAGFLPMFLISPFGGVFADRFNRKYLINMADGAIAFASLIVAILLVIGFDHIGILLACAIVRSFGQGVQSPAIGAVIPQIVPEEHLTRVNGIQNSIQSFITLSAPMISGLFMTFTSIETLFFFDVITAVIGIGILFFFVKIPVKKETDYTTDKKGLEYFYDLKEGMRYINKHKYILHLIILSGLLVFFMAPMGFLGYLQTSRNFGDDAWRLSAIEVSYSVGMLAGGVLIGIWGGFKNRMFTLALTCVLFGLGSIGLGLVNNFWIYLSIWPLPGVMMSFYNTTVMVLLQSTVENEYMGRIHSFFTMIISAMAPVAMLLFGPVADRLSINFLFIASGIILTLLAIPFLASKTLQKAGKNPA